MILLAIRLITSEEKKYLEAETVIGLDERSFSFFRIACNLTRDIYEENRCIHVLERVFSMETCFHH